MVRFDGQRSVDRRFFKLDKPPLASTGRLVAAWALDHVCDTNPGGVNEPYQSPSLIAAAPSSVLGRLGMQLDQHKQLITEAHNYLSAFPSKVFETKNTPEIPK